MVYYMYVIPCQKSTVVETTSEMHWKVGCSTIKVMAFLHSHWLYFLGMVWRSAHGKILLLNTEFGHGVVGKKCTMIYKTCTESFYWC